MKKLWRKFVSWILSIPDNYRLYFVAGLMISAIFCIWLGMKVCIVPAILAGFIKEFFSSWSDTNRKMNWWNLLAATLGGLFIELLVVLSLIM